MILFSYGKGIGSTANGNVIGKAFYVHAVKELVKLRNLRLVEEIDEISRNFLYLLTCLSVSLSFSLVDLRGRLFCFI